MFHILLGDARDDLDRVTPRSQEGLCTEIKQSKQRGSHIVILNENPCSRPEEPSEKSVLQTSRETPLPQSSAETLEQGIEDNPRKQLELLVPQYEPGEWKHEFKMSSFTTAILNLVFTEAEKKGKIRNFRMCIGPGSGGSSADKLSLDLKFKPWDAAITFRPEWRSMSKTPFTQYHPFETWYTFQSDVWLDGVKTLYLRPMRCVIVVHPFPLDSEDPALLKKNAFLSCAKICLDQSRFSPDLHKDRRVTLNKKQKNKISDSTSYITEIHQTMWGLLTNTIPHGRPIMFLGPQRPKRV